MKKSEFLDAINGLTIKVSFYNSMFDENDRSAKAEIEGLPESLKEMHVNQVLSNLRAWCSDYCQTEDHPNLKAWDKEHARLFDQQSEGVVVADSAIDDAYIWQEWCEQHPTLIFKYVKD